MKKKKQSKLNEKPRGKKGKICLMKTKLLLKLKKKPKKLRKRPKDSQNRHKRGPKEPKKWQLLMNCEKPRSLNGQSFQLKKGESRKQNGELPEKRRKKPRRFKKLEAEVEEI